MPGNRSKKNSNACNVNDRNANALSLSLWERVEVSVNSPPF